MEQRLEELTRHLCSIREVATQLVRLQLAWDDHGPSLAQWRLFASRLSELFTLLELPLQLRDDLPVTDPASDPATGLPADGPWQQLPLTEVSGIPPRACKSLAAGQLTTLGQLADWVIVQGRALTEFAGIGQVTAERMVAALDAQLAVIRAEQYPLVQLPAVQQPQQHGFLPFHQAPLHNWQAHLENIHRCYDVIEQLHALAGDQQRVQDACQQADRLLKHRADQLVARRHATRAAVFELERTYRELRELYDWAHARYHPDGLTAQLAATGEAPSPPPPAPADRTPLHRHDGRQRQRQAQAGHPTQQHSLVSPDEVPADVRRQHDPAPLPHLP